MVAMLFLGPVNLLQNHQAVAEDQKAKRKRFLHACEENRGGGGDVSKDLVMQWNRGLQRAEEPQAQNSRNSSRKPQRIRGIGQRNGLRTTMIYSRH